VNIYKWADQTYLMHSYTFLFAPGSDALPPDFPSTREIDIQLGKWANLLDERSNAILVRVPSRKLKQVGLRGLTKKQLREDGRLTSQTMQQGRKVHKLVIESFRQYFTEHFAKNGRKHSKHDFAKFRERWETSLLEFKRNFFKAGCDKSMFEKIEKDAIRRMTLPLKQIDNI
jgi:hypothetical protein